MTLLFNCQSLSKSFGHRLLFKGLSFSVFSGDQVGFIGPNGSGKSTLLKILAGIESPSIGMVSAKRGLKIGYVPQSSEFPHDKPEKILFQSLINTEMQDYEKELLVQTFLSKLGFSEKEKYADQLSGGWKKRLSLAQALITSPDLLLLDEPTNHLDLEGILWLEKFLKREAPSYLLVSHDRVFLQNMTNRVIEINPIFPSGLFAIDGNYAHFLEKKEEFVQGQLEQERSLASKARRELEWLRQSPKARTSKSKSRVNDAHELMQELTQVRRRNRQKITEIDFSATERETRKLIVCKNLTKQIGNRKLFQHLDLTLSPGTRIGLMGPNGSGKTTLLQIIAGEMSPDRGTLKKADDLKVVYFEQHRMKLPLHYTLREAFSPQGDFVDFRGQKIHINGWCSRFLFPPDILDMPLEKLSGGERARIAIAHLMLQPADILLLDEPTNDLDIPTLETLEESLLDFPGALILITHDRSMLGRICNKLLALGNPEQNDLFVEYNQWEASLEQPEKKATEPKTTEEPKQSKVKLSYSEKKEYEQIETKILQQEEGIRLLNHELEKPEITENPTQLQAICTQIGLAEARLEQLYLRWDELDKKSRGLSC